MCNRAKECKETVSNPMQELGRGDHRKIFYREETPDRIWRDVFANHPEDHESFKALCISFRQMAFHGIQGRFAKLLAPVVYTHFYRRQGSYIEESDWLAERSEGVLSPAQMAFVQRAYSWAHLGCSTMCVWDAERQENVVMRSLDWQGAPALGKVTRIFDFIGNDDDGQVDFTAVGVIGMLGILTGMKPGFAAIINYAPWYDSALDKDMDPTFKLRQLLENSTINTYDQAVGAVLNWEVSSPVFITLCGAEKDQACVVEIGAKDRKALRKSVNGLLVQTNHFDPQGLFKEVEEKMDAAKQQKTYPVNEKGERLADDDWYCGKLIPHSAVRRAILEEKFTDFSGSSEQLEKSFIAAYNTPPVWNWETAYWTVMRPKSMSMRVLARN